MKTHVKNTFGSFRKLFLLSLLGTLLSSPVMAFYTDVEMGSFIYPAIKYFTEKEFISGYADGTLRVDSPINRSEALKVILVATEEPLIEGMEIGFTDVPADAWFAPYVIHAKAKGIISGDGESGLFSPARRVNRAEFIKMTLEAFDVNVSEYDLSTVSVTDVPADAWFAPYINFAVKFGILKKDDLGNVSPGEYITRGESIYLLYRTMDRGRGLEPTLLIELTERHLVYALEVLESEGATQAAIAVAAARAFINILMQTIPKNTTVQAVSYITEAMNNLIGASIAAENGISEDVIIAAKAAWADADSATLADPKQAEGIAAEIKRLAGAIAKNAREIQARVEESGGIPTPTPTEAPVPAEGTEGAAVPAPSGVPTPATGPAPAPAAEAPPAQ